MERYKENALFVPLFVSGQALKTFMVNRQDLVESLDGDGVRLEV